MPDLLERLTAALADRYAIEREAGRGGMAVVFKAEDLKHHRHVAIKVLHPELTATLGAERFLREIEIAAGLDHPHILSLIDSGETEGVLYYVMPFVEGESLRSRLEREQQLPIEEAIRIAREVADGLGYAHRHGVIHRDIKPANIMLSEGHALIADFGVARAVSGEGQALTSTGLAVGTPAYMSPEQASGGEMDARTDLYALGCVLYEMLAGLPPLTGPTPQATAAMRLTETATPLPVVRETVAGGLARVANRLLAKSPADRYGTAEKLIDALDRPDLWAEVKPERRVWRQVASVAVVLLTLGVLATQWFASRSADLEVVPQRVAMLPFENRAGDESLDDLGVTRDPRRIAVLYFEPRSPQEEVPYLAAGLTEALINELAAVGALRVTSRRGSALFRGGVLPTDSIGRTLQVGTIVDGTVALSEDQVRVDVTLLRAATGEALHRQQFVRPKAEMFELQAELARQVAFFLREMLGEEVELIERQAGTESVEAWEYLQRAQAQSDLATQLADRGNESAWDRFASADSLLSLAEEYAPEWVEPWIRRGRLAYQRSRWAGIANPTQADRWIEEGMNQATIALQLQAEHPDALELRGTLRYWKWLLDLEPDSDAAEELVAGAESDLRQAIVYDSSQAGAWAILSHLLLNKGSTAEGKMAAEAAYRADAYLRNAAVILWRLFSASYDLEDKAEAEQWCGELRRRFPNNQRAIECGLWHMTMDGAPAEVDSAWTLVAAYERTLTPQNEEFFKRWAGMAMAAVLARASLADSASAVAARSRGDPDMDPIKDLVYLEAFVRTLTGENDLALDLLLEYMAIPGQDPSEVDHWWFDSLRDEPRYRALARSGATEQ